MQADENYSRQQSVGFKEIFLCAARVSVGDLDVATDLLDDGRLVQRPDVPARK
jgi:hypothetical protein